MKLTHYIKAAMHHAQYQRLEDGSFSGEILELQDVWAHGTTLAECQANLQCVLEEWLIDQMYLHHTLPPVIDNINLDPNFVSEVELQEAREALAAARQEGTIPWEQVKQELGL